MAGQNFNISFVIGAVDNLSLKVMKINERVNKAFAPLQKLSSSVNFLGAELGVAKLGTAFSKVGEKGRAAFDALKGAGVLLVGTLATVGGAFSYIVRGAGNTADELQDVNNRLGISTEMFQTLQYGATQSGVRLEKLEPLLTKLSVNLAEASEGGNRTAAIFQSLGIGIKDATGGVLPMEQLLPKLADKLSAIQNPTIRNKIAFELFGKEGVKFAQVLQGGSKGLEEFRARAQKLGIILGDDLIKSGASFNDKFEEMSLVFSRLRDSIGAELFPVLTELMNQLIEIFVANKKDIIDFAKAFAKDLPANLKAVGEALKAIGAVLSPVVVLFKAVTSIFGVSNTVIGALALVITGKLILAVYALGGALVQLGIVAAATPIGWIAIGIGLVIAAIAALIVYWEPIKNFFMGLFDLFSNSPFAMLLGPLGALIFMGRQLYNSWEPIMQLFSSIGGAIGGVVDRVGGALGLGNATGGTGPASNAPGIAEALTSTRAGASSTESRVVVDFNNLPTGTRVKTEKAESPLDLNLGYGMATP